MKFVETKKPSAFVIFDFLRPWFTKIQRFPQSVLWKTKKIATNNELNKEMLLPITCFTGPLYPIKMWRTFLTFLCSIKNIQVK